MFSFYHISFYSRRLKLQVKRYNLIIIFWKNKTITVKYKTKKNTAIKFIKKNSEAVIFVSTTLNINEFTDHVPAKSKNKIKRQKQNYTLVKELLLFIQAHIKQAFFMNTFREEIIKEKYFNYNQFLKELFSTVKYL